MTLALAASLERLLDDRPEVTDLHLAAGEALLVRAWGELCPVGERVVAAAELLALVAVLSPATLPGLGHEPGLHLQQHPGAETGNPSLARLRARTGGAIDLSGELGAHRLRGNLHLRAGGALGLVLRRLRDTVPGLDALGLPALLPRLAERSRGLLLVTGPTGAGKSTTLAALVRHLAGARALHVLTIEDPIEYRFDRPGAVPMPLAGRITAREIGTDVPDFAGAVRAALRQDPDVIVIGEVRDRATMHAALAAAETGHLVLATLHSPNASEAVERVLSFFAPDEMSWARSVFANVLIAVLAQALLRRRGEPAVVPVCELMVNTPAVRQQIVQGTPGQLRGIMAQGRRDGHLQMTAQLAERVRRGEIELEQARQVAHPPEEFDYLVQSLSIAGTAGGAAPGRMAGAS